MGAEAAPVLATNASEYSPGAAGSQRNVACTLLPTIVEPMEAPAGSPATGSIETVAPRVEVEAVRSNVSSLPIFAAKWNLSGCVGEAHTTALLAPRAVGDSRSRASAANAKISGSVLVGRKAALA